MTKQEFDERGEARMRAWVADWCKFAREALFVNLDPEQEAILRSVQYNSRTSVASGTARGKDFVTAVAAVCFMYLTPKFDKKTGVLTANTKVALTAPTDRQVKNIMMPEISRIWHRARRHGVDLPGRLTMYDIRTESEEWFLTGFKADEHNHEAWTGFHAVNTMFAITEASGIKDETFNAIEGNLQGESRIILVFNPNTTLGYAAKSQKSARWTRFTLNSLTAPNIKERRTVIPGQVDYAWIVDKLENWCIKIEESEIIAEEDDFEFEGQWYRPDDTFRVKILGKFPKVSADSLIPAQWIEAAQERWLAYTKTVKETDLVPMKLGVDVAGMGRDSSVFCPRHGDYVKKMYKINSAGQADHMQIAGRIINTLDRDPRHTAYIDTIGEGAGVYSRTCELGYEDRAFSCKYSESARDDQDDFLHDFTGEYKFANMRAYLFWAVRDWLNPKFGSRAMLPPGDALTEEATEIKWKFRSSGDVIIEPKEDIKKRLGRSTDEFDALANTFYPSEMKIMTNFDEIEDAFR